MNPRTLKIGLSLMPESAYLDASYPLFNSGEVDVIEWSFDMCWGATLPDRCHELLHSYSATNNLLGHGVSFSLLTARRTERQKLWLEYLECEVKKFNYRNISEHFGFLTTDKFIQGAPLSMPYMPEMVKIGINNIQQIKQIAQCPIGIENLGFAFSRQDVIEQGKFMTELLDATNSFLLLDIHNIYCHMINFNMSFDEICETLPIHRTTEIHISGGSYREIIHENQHIYCDSHDAKIPEDVFRLLEENLYRFPHVETCIFERMGNTLLTQQDSDEFRNDFMTLKSTINKATHARNQ